ncbi:hypothetical protein ALQ88_02651 [Pseudomonas savastanoi]|nr:hypothetical protein ALQ88_02651 [Pseudomonas savastanoi]
MSINRAERNLSLHFVLVEFHEILFVQRVLFHGFRRFSDEGSDLMFFVPIRSVPLEGAELHGRFEPFQQFL